MKILLTFFFLFSMAFAQQSSQGTNQNLPLSDEKMEAEVKQLAEIFTELHLEEVPFKDRGRLKPLDSLARENNLFLMGKKSLWGIPGASLFMALHIYENTAHLKIINLRSTELRESLKLEMKRTLFSLSELEQTPIMDLAREASVVEKQNRNLMTPMQTAQVELANQMWLVKSIQGGEILFQGLIYKEGDNNNRNQTAMQNMLSSISSKQPLDVIKNWAQELKISSATASVEKQFMNQRSRMSLEVFYNKAKFFFWAGMIYAILSFLSFLPQTKNMFNDFTLSTILIIPLFMLAVGFGIRVYITEFPPVTNMYGTMVWVSFGISFFSYLMYLIYKDRNILAIMSLGAALLLLLTENIPLIISPNMDPIVAVLRSSYWLTIHVLTVTISYAALSMAMILGNIVIIRALFNKVDEDQVKRFSHYAYRSIQLGVLLLTAGIILGGVWADYSWGRFWGWDPKETWALIADLGFLAILHARFAGWISPTRLLLLSPLAYTLVIMAWFGVNFVLATGLHSYGFSSGGTFMVVSSILLQFGILGVYYLKAFAQKKITAL